MWTDWIEWGDCSVSCAGGSQTRDRQCLGTKHNGKYCEGDHEQSRLCNTHKCPGQFYHNPQDNGLKTQKQYFPCMYLFYFPK